MKKSLLISVFLLSCGSIIAQGQTFSISSTKSYINDNMNAIRLENPQKGLLNINEQMLNFGTAGLWILDKVTRRTKDKLYITGHQYGTVNYAPANFVITKNSITIFAKGMYVRKDGTIDRNAKFKMVYNTSLLKL